jgi:hypothetical protein
MNPEVLTLTKSSKLSTVIKANVNKVLDSTKSIQDNQNSQKFQEVLEWLSPSDYPAQQHDIIQRREKGTGQWFLQSTEFKEWCEGLTKRLFCPGIPGAGKTMMAAIAIDELSQTISDDFGLAYIYFSYKSQSRGLLDLLCAILKQLAAKKEAIAELIQRLYDEHWKKNTRPSVDRIFETLKSACALYSRVYLVIDALDEAHNDQCIPLGHKLEDLREKIDLHLLVTSRFIPVIEHWFASVPKLEIRASNEDVRCYVASQVTHLPSCIQNSEELKMLVSTKISEAVDGMYVVFQ